MPRRVLVDGVADVGASGDASGGGGAGDVDGDGVMGDGTG